MVIRTECWRADSAIPSYACTFVYPVVDSRDLARSLTGGSTSMLTTMPQEPTSSASRAVLPGTSTNLEDARASLHAQPAEHTSDNFGRRR